MYFTLAHIIEVVDRLNLTRMIAFDGEGHTIDSAEFDTDTELVDRITELVGNASGTIRLECWQAPHPRKPGQTKAEAAKVERCAWRVRGTFGAAAAAAAEVAHPAQRETVTTAPVMDVATAVKVARMEWELERLRLDLAAYDESDGDEGDEGPEPVAAAVVEKGLLGMSGDQTFQFLSGLKEIVVPMLSPGQRTVGAVPAGPSVSAQELQMIEAFKRFQQAMPEQAGSLVTELMTNFGPNAKPPETPPANG